VFRLLALLLLPVRRALAPPAPGRFADLTRLFRVAFPDADAERWEAHCGQLAAAAYWEGERRGYDRARGVDDEALRLRHDWTLPTRVRASLAQLRGPDDPLAAATPEQLAKVREAVEGGWSFELRETGEDPDHAGIPRPPQTRPRQRGPA
jgi:hypothetical protein